MSGGCSEGPGGEGVQLQGGECCQEGVPETVARGGGKSSPESAVVSNLHRNGELLNLATCFLHRPY